MFQEKIESRSLLAWAAAGIAAPAAHYFGSIPWYQVLLAGGAAAVLWLVAWKQNRTPGKTMAAVQFLFLTLAASLAASACGGSWDQGGSWAVPVSLLALSAWAASHGGRTGARYGAVVFLLSAFLYGALLIFAIPDVEARYLFPSWRWGGGTAFAVLLIPGILRFFPREDGGKPGFWALGLTLFGGALALLTAGNLSPRVAAYTQGAFFKMVQGVSILGIAERFEAVVSGAMTMGWFCLLSLFFTAAGHLTEAIFPGREKWGVWASAVLAGVGMFWADQIPAAAFSLGALLLWGLMPICPMGWKKPDEKILPKSEKDG